MHTATPRHLASKPDKKALVEEYVGKPLQALRTPAFVIDRSIFAQNCARMHENARNWRAGFRAHIKTHKVRFEVLLKLALIILCADHRRNKASVEFDGGQGRGNRSININGSLVGS
jgi:hypothetical protein